jgi:DNA-binding transcriptional LysR family regulator
MIFPTCCYTLSSCIKEHGSGATEERGLGAVMLDVRRLRVLREVARRGSFSAAAEALSFTQPAISRQIAALELEAGAQLVDRGARGVRLTPAGELLVEHADVILDRLATAETQLEALAGLAAGRLRLGTFGTANATLLPLAIRAFAAEHPAVELQLVEGVSSVLVGRMLAGEVDLAIVTGPDLADVQDIELEHLMDDPLYVALPTDHPLADAPEVRMADLRDETWIEGHQGVCEGPLVDAARAAGFEPRIGFEANQWLGKQGLVAAGVGVTLFPRVALDTVRDDIVLRSLGDDAPVRRLYLATQACGYRAPAVEPMKAILRRVASEYCFECAPRLGAPGVAA